MPQHLYNGTHHCHCYISTPNVSVGRSRSGFYFRPTSPGLFWYFFGTCSHLPLSPEKPKKTPRSSAKHSQPPIAIVPPRSKKPSKTNRRKITSDKKMPESASASALRSRSHVPRARNTGPTLPSFARRRLPFLHRHRTSKPPDSTDPALVMFRTLPLNAYRIRRRSLRGPVAEGVKDPPQNTSRIRH